MTDDVVKNKFFEQVLAFRSGKRKKYPNLLAEPRFVGPSKDQRYREMVDVAMQWQWRLLFMTYDIHPDEPSSWELLARALAERHVPGVGKTSKPPKVRKGPGRNRTRGNRFIVELCRAWDAAIARCAEDKKIPVEDVMDKVAVAYIDSAFRERWRQPNGAPLKDSTLKTRYSEAKELWDKVRADVEALGGRPSLLQAVGLGLADWDWVKD